MSCYKIRDRSTGLFSTGGLSPRWTKRGKTWNKLNHLKCHLAQGQTQTSYKGMDCEVIEYETVESVHVLLRDVDQLSSKSKKKMVKIQSMKKPRMDRVLEDD